jgi:hypothetical protein
MTDRLDIFLEAFEEFIQQDYNLKDALRASKKVLEQYDIRQKHNDFEDKYKNTFDE